MSGAAETSVVTLGIGGMTCASCASRIERQLNKLDGVSASVNYALEQASVSAPEGTSVDDLIGAVEAVGYDAWVPGAALDTHEHDIQALGPRVAVVALLGVPVILLGMVPALQFDRWQWVSLVLTVPIVTWGAWPFHRAAWANLRHASATMDTLVSGGVIAAFTWSLCNLVFGDAGEPGLESGFTLMLSRSDAATSTYFEVVAATTLFLLLGRWFETRARRRGADALRALADLGAKQVAVLRPDGREELRPTDELRPGDRFVVRPGEKVATDGVIEEGSSAIDASLLTGEATPIEVAPGDRVTGATVNAGGRLVVRATRVGADTTLAQMTLLVAEAQSGKAEVQRLADRVSAVFVPAVLVLSVATLGFWLGRGFGASFAFSAAIAVLIVACPCALGLATPTALLVGTGRGAQLGILIRGPEILEATRQVDTIVLDKTGTVTSGRMTLLDLVLADGTDEDEARVLFASLEAASEHPIGRAIARSVDEANRKPVSEFHAAGGLGVSGGVDGHRVLAGRTAFLADAGLRLPADLEDARRRAEALGYTAVAVGWDGVAHAVAIVGDTIKPSSAAAIRELRRLGLEPVLLTGDNAPTAHAVATQVGINRVEAEVLPADKVDVIKRLQASDRTVAMVGDGVNDAPALAQADLGLAVGTGTDAAIAAADLTLVRGDLMAAVDAIRLSRRTLRTIKANLVWAFGYNVAAIPIAAAGLLNPMLAGIAMAMSSVFVVANSLRLFRFRAA
jgi:P-type Cu+ transporter